TDEGREVGRFLLKRHEIIETFLEKLGVQETLLKDTEMMEHDMSLNTVKSIHAFNQFVQDNPDVMQRYEIFKNKFYKDNSFAY
ncbi:MAG: DtxR family transcriptional regulator, partial [Clostridia bacterium]|nr:DtxR family transcriptional regulator [Clostridia bacterium]